MAKRSRSLELDIQVSSQFFSKHLLSQSSPADRPILILNTESLSDQILSFYPLVAHANCSTSYKKFSIG
jgi:hypothetical protein